MYYLLCFVFLIFLTFYSNCIGKLFEKLTLPSLIGMMIAGLIIGPYGFNKVPESIIKIGPILKDIALVVVLFIGGLGISTEQIKKIGRPAILLSVIPATLEGFVIAYLSTIFLNFSFVQGAILGFIIAAVSPAVLIPSMVSLIEKNVGQKKAIPQLLLVGASADDTIAITFFTSFLAVYFQQLKGENFDIYSQLLVIPLSIIFSLFVAWLVGIGGKYTFLKLKNKNIKISIIFIVILLIRFIENRYHYSIFNSLLIVMFFAFFIRYYEKDEFKIINQEMNRIWKYGKIYLFTFVGMAINPKLIGNYFIIGIIILLISLSIRSIGVLISLIGTNLTYKERLFCIISYLPKATVQSAKSGIPLQLGVAGGEIMQSIAILSVLITAPLGAIGIKKTYKRLLEEERNP